MVGIYCIYTRDGVNVIYGMSLATEIYNTAM